MQIHMKDVGKRRREIYNKKGSRQKQKQVTCEERQRYNKIKDFRNGNIKIYMVCERNTKK